MIQTISIESKGRPIDIEYQWVGAEASAAHGATVIVFLHEGLGSIAMWKDFPAAFCKKHGFRGLVFSRHGYGRSTPRPVEEAVPFTYLHEQAHDALPSLLAALGISRPWLFGHSDGGSIALLYAARFPDDVSGIVVVAPHIFVEEITLQGILKARQAASETDLLQRLGRYHIDPVSVFKGWNDTWLRPEFRRWNIEDQLSLIRCPVLAVQGVDDEYGTLAQIDGIVRQATQSRQAKALPLEYCGHSPHRDQPEELGRQVSAFIHAHTE
jgi:pimeloyl-ACP methyl ester carboxylesterase